MGLTQCRQVGSALEKLCAHPATLTPVTARVDGAVCHATGRRQTWVVVPMSALRAELYVQIVSWFRTRRTRWRLSV
jgi:hypothetical protein